MKQTEIDQVRNVRSCLLWSSVQGSALEAYRDVRFVNVDTRDLRRTSPAFGVLVGWVEPNVNEIFGFVPRDLYGSTVLRLVYARKSVPGMRLNDIDGGNFAYPSFVFGT